MCGFRRVYLHILPEVAPIGSTKIRIALLLKKKFCIELFPKYLHDCSTEQGPKSNNAGIYFIDPTMMF